MVGNTNSKKNIPKVINTMSKFVHSASNHFPSNLVHMTLSSNQTNYFQLDLSLSQVQTNLICT